VFRRTKKEKKRQASGNGVLSDTMSKHRETFRVFMEDTPKIDLEFFNNLTKEGTDKMEKEKGVTFLELLVFVLVLAVFWGLAAIGFAQPITTPEVVVVAEEASKWMNPENLNSIAQIIMVIIAIASPFLLKGFHALIALAMKKSQNDLVDQLLLKADIIMPAVVKAVYEDYVKGIKVGTLDKKLTADEIKNANKRAYDKVTGILGPVAMATLSKNGMDLQQYVEGLCGVHVEAAKLEFGKVSEEDLRN